MFPRVRFCCPAGCEFFGGSVSQVDFRSYLSTGYLYQYRTPYMLQVACKERDA